MQCNTLHFQISFCYATLCTAYAVVRCLSVRPSVTFLYCIVSDNALVYCFMAYEPATELNETSKHILKLVSSSYKPIVLVFHYQTLWQYSDGGPPLTGTSNAGVI